ncbi:MAG: beta-glucosidase [Cytophagales bacterium]|jgi:beta-glucosidase|nr:MAG: beta-glucosidase [Cytophagales bacterium]
MNRTLHLITKKSILPFMVIAIMFSCQKQKNNSRMNRKVDSLMSLMTIEEKIGQLNLPSAGYFKTGEAASSDIGKKIEQGKVGGLFNIKGAANVREMQRIAMEKSRMKIPLIFGMDVIHGYETVFPIPLGLSCSWDTDLIQQTARMAATEASADGINWGYSPMVDLARDARWGRIAEGSGEDPYLGSRIAEAMVKGYQGNDLSAANTIMACVKHYALYGASEAGRDYNVTDMSHLRMYNDYFPPYKAAVDAGVGSVMASFNEIDGVPATANHWLLTDVLRNEWGFTGMLVSDYTGVSEMVQHGIGDLQTVSARALGAGIDMDMVSEGFLTTLTNSLKEGKITEQQINQACRRVLEAKYKLGLLDDPYRYCNEARAEKEIFTDSNRAFSRSVAAQSFVLLKNQNHLLPLKKQGTIALIGPLADAVENVTGTWSVAARFSESITLRKGLEKATTHQAKVLYAKGSNLYNDAYLEENATPFGKTLHRDKRNADELREEALRVAKQADVIVAALGESAEMTGEASSRTDIGIPDTQVELLKALLNTGKPVVLVLFNGRPMTLKWENEHVPAILDVWFGGSEAGDAIADVLFGEVNPSGKLTTTFPQNIGQVPTYYAQRNTGRPMGKWFEKFRSGYLDVSNDPVYPFGFGLSYAQFEYGEIRLNKTTMTSSDSIMVSIDVTNKGPLDGKEVVQVYLHDEVGSITRPVKELKRFKKIKIKAGETQTVNFILSNKDLSFYKSDLSFGSEPGKFEVFVGGDSQHVKRAEFELK